MHASYSARCVTGSGSETCVTTEYFSASTFDPRFRLNHFHPLDATQKPRAFALRATASTIGMDEAAPFNCSSAI